MAWFWWLIGVLVLIMWVVAVVDIIRRRHNRTAGKTAAWILIVLILPVLGTIIYFLVNGTGDPGVPRGDTDVSRMPGH
jgi:hypothetical protein